jgi:hypothetical protein|tara:strand:+ start:400 stop:531 length:132 start_codon:yes stop_codon:yes gene_type:complete
MEREGEEGGGREIEGERGREREGEKKGQGRERACPHIGVLVDA